MKLDALAAFESVDRRLEADGNRAGRFGDLIRPFPLAERDATHRDAEVADLERQMTLALAHFLRGTGQFAV